MAGEVARALYLHYGEVRRRLDSPRQPETIQTIIQPEIRPTEIRPTRLFPMNLVIQPTVQSGPRRIASNDVFKHVADAEGVTVEYIKGKCKIDSVIALRHLVMYLLHALTGLSTPHIGRAFVFSERPDPLDHTTVIHAINTAIPKRRAAFPEYDSKIVRYEAELRSVFVCRGRRIKSRLITTTAAAPPTDA